ncbi:MAG: right-handed parallel beta-helix repeat-containing protein, partial [Opitutaceae bacterium]|nr:right-handed parallel beta-helix repeat-containing protein [Opitutaceae bacterium]
LRVAGCPEGTPKKVNYHTDCQTFEFKPGDIRADWTNLSDVEVIVYHFWTDSHLPIKSVNTATNVVTFAHKAGKVFTDDFTEDGARYIVENVFEGLDTPGEWYLNRRTGQLYYYPMPGENMNESDIVAPVTSAFLQLHGEVAGRRFVEHLRFRDLSFTHTHFELPAGNSNDRQGSASVPAAITLEAARSCSFEHCRLTQLGTFAFDLRRGCSGNQLVGNEIAHVAAGGFRLDGGTERNPPWERTHSNVVSDNWLHHYGLDYPSAVGVLLMHTEKNVVTHNHVHHGGYTGISVGWVWGYTRSVSQLNRIEFNHIHDIGRGLLSDMGGIYTLGVSPGTVIRNNHIHDVDANHYGGWGIYLDEGSTHLLVENNVVHHTKFAGFNIHYAKEVTVRNNIFALGRLEQVSRTRNEPHRSLYFENNIVYWRDGELFSKNWKDEPYSFYAQPKKDRTAITVESTFECDWNLYFNPTRPRNEIKWARGSWAEWQQRGKDPHSRYDDPRFADPERGDFTLAADSPALALGFQPIDIRAAAPRVKPGPR